MGAVDEPRNGLTYRVASLERAVNKLESYEPAVQKQRIDTLIHELDEVKEEVRGLTKALYTVAGSIILIGAGAIITALQIAG